LLGWGRSQELLRKPGEGTDQGGDNGSGNCVAFFDSFLSSVPHIPSVSKPLVSTFRTHSEAATSHGLAVMEPPPMLQGPFFTPQGADQSVNPSHSSYLS
jgi:hypothetical protein